MKPWLKSEIEWCAHGKTSNAKKPNGNDADQLVYEARSLDKNFRRAEALILEDKVSIDFMQLVKVLLSRGHLEQARVAMEHASTSIEKDSLDFWELAFEQARLFSYEGNWEKTKELTTQIISSCPTGITVMGSYQIQALAHAEMGNFKNALSDVEKVISLGTLYPKAFSLFYAEVQKARLLFLTENFLASEKLRNRLWDQILPTPKGGKLDLDILLTLVRLELFSKKLFSIQEVYDLLRVQWTCSDIMGDDLYRSFTEAYGFILGLTNSISNEARQFERVRNLLTGTTTEANHLQNLKSYLEISSPKEGIEPVRLIYLSSKQLLLDLTSGQIHPVSKKHHLLLEIFKNTDQVSMEEVFHKVSGFTYKANVHRNYISNLIYQVNKIFYGAFKIQNGDVVPDRLVVLIP